MAQDAHLLESLEFFVVIIIANNWCSECQCRDLLWQKLHGLIIRSFQLCGFEGKQVCQATAKTRCAGGSHTIICQIDVTWFMHQFEYRHTYHFHYS
jgi:hypothetical protein